MSENYYKESGYGTIFDTEHRIFTDSIEPVGVDYGNEYIKLKTSERELSIVNLIAPGRDRRKLSPDRAHPVNLLDVEIESNGDYLGRWFIGGMAYKYSHNRLQTREEGGNKADYTYLIHSVLTGLAYSFYDENEPVKTVQLVLGTGLSAEEYWQYPQHRDLLQERFVGTHVVKFMNPAFHQAVITLEIEDVAVMPESSSAALAYVTEEDGNVNQVALADLEDSVNIIVDIGGFTTDIAVLYGGEFEDSFGFDGGIAEPISHIVEGLRRKHGINVTRQQVDIAIRKNNCILKTRQGDSIDISDMKEAHFKDFTVQMGNRLLRGLRDNDITRNQVNKAYFVGGGALVLESYIRKYINGLDIAVINAPIMANARGYYVSVLDIEKHLDNKVEEYDVDDIFME